MDENGTFRAKAEDWDELAAAFRKKENLLFPYCADGMTALIVSINREFNLMGKMPYGGHPGRRAWVSIKDRGAHHIDIDDMQHPRYLEEHLNIPLEDAVHLADLLNELRKRRL
ncbi:MAG: hypothetical protein R3B45_07705 [Bdellovibrionota bacterium]